MGFLQPCGRGRLAATCMGGWQEQAFCGHTHQAGLRGIFIFTLSLFSLSEVMTFRTQH